MTQQLNIDIIARDKSKQALDNVQKNLHKTGNSVLNLKNALIGLGTGVVVRSLLNIGVQAEQAQVRLNLLTGSTKLGSQAFEQFTKFAINAKIPLEEVINSSRKLISLGSSPEKLAKNLEMISNISALTGLSFETTVDQFQKATTKGLDSARIFTDENIRILLGIPKGLEVGGEQALRFFEKDFSSSGRFGQINKNIKNTVAGTIVGIKNIFFLFNSEITKGFFGSLRNQLGDLELFFNNNKKVITEFAINLGEGLGKAIVIVGKGFKFIVDNMNFFIEAIKILIAFKLILFFTNLATSINVATTAMRLLNLTTRKNILIAGGAVVLSQLDKIIAKYKEFRGISDIDVKDDEDKKVIGISKPMPESTFFDKLKMQLLTFKDSLKTLNENELKNFQSSFQTIGFLIAEGLNKGIKQFSEAFAKSVILGEKLSESLRNMAQAIGVQLLSALIEYLARKSVEYLFEQMILQTQKNKTSEIQKQLDLQKKQNKAQGTAMLLSGNPLGFLGFMANGGAVSKGKPYMVGEQGPEMFIPNSTGQISQSARGTGGGAVSVNFNINTLDARGFDELLVRNRGTITQIINSAVNERGGKNLI